MTDRRYDAIALPVTIWFNKYYDHDHDGLMYVLKEHQAIIKYVKDIQQFFSKLEQDDDKNGRRVAANTPDSHNSDRWQSMPEYRDFLPEWKKIVSSRANLIKTYKLVDKTPRCDEWLPDTKEKAQRPHPAIVPLAIRANLGDTVTINLKNEIPGRKIGLHLVGPGTDEHSDGSHIGNNPDRLIAYDREGTFTWQCDREGVFVFHDAGDFRGDEAGTNVHGLFGALIVEPAGTYWTDPETGDPLASGLYADVHQQTKAELDLLKTTHKLAPYPAPNRPESLTTEYPAAKASFREFVIFIHDEPHWVPPHVDLEPNPCDDPNVPQAELMQAHTAGSLMPMSYRAEPMISRERVLWKKMKAGEIDPNNIVVNEEQHHSSWLFGDPSTPVLRAYLGDPVRIRLVHAGVKETHVFHLHVYEWNAIPFHRDSNIIDAITISPQTGHTIVPFYGAGNRQMVPGDVIWHCHLYPHFHHGMWGIFRTFDKLQSGALDGEYFDGVTGKALTKSKVNAIADRRKRNQIVRQLNRYPDLTSINKLVPLPDREAPPPPTITHPGYPLFIAGEVAQKSFTPPWHQPKAAVIAEGWAVDEYDYREPTQLELNAFNSDPRPGELYTTFPYPDRDRLLHRSPESGEILPQATTVRHNIDVLMTPIEYNDHGWWDPHGHLYALADEPHGIQTFAEVVHAAAHHAQSDGHILKIEPTQQQPLFLRCRKTEVMELTLHNRLEKHIAATPFDSAWPKGSDKMVGQKPGGKLESCKKFDNYRGECGLHVHIVKFDPICCDGASTGWNYISGPQFGKKLVYRWWADEEFGTIFAHDHLFANFRQKHGLFAALLVEPEGATFHDPADPTKEIIVGQSAVIRCPEQNGLTAYREFCFGNADWVPLFKQAEQPAMGGMGMGMGMGMGHGEAAGAAPFVAQVTYKSHEKLNTTTIAYGIPIEPPNMQDAHNDNGVFAVNYRCEPLAERPHDPSEWFNSKPFVTQAEEHGDLPQQMTYGDPNTAIFHTLPGEPIRLRLLQGSHEEQHSFQLHGLRWHRFWHDKNSPLRNQQTLGISEAFSFDIREAYGAGDYLWKYSSSDDLWLGLWGLLRAHKPNSKEGKKLPPLMKKYLPPAPLQHPAPKQCRRFKVVAKSKTIAYSPILSDPFGLTFELQAWAAPGQTQWQQVTPTDEPLVLRCLQGEWVEIELINNLPKQSKLVVEPSAPELPHDDGMRKISDRVSLHADLLTYDVTQHDGSNVGLNHNSTIENPKVSPADKLYEEKSHTYYWLADRDVGAVLLQDMADFRNHRHHGSIGALVIEDPATVPYSVAPDATTADIVTTAICWHGARATIYNPSTQAKTEEMVLLLQDGLRYYLFGNPAVPIGDLPGDPGENGPDTEDQGLKGFNYKSEPSSHARGYAFTPSTPVFNVSPGANLKLHLVGACDKPRNHSFTIHGHSWQEWPYLGKASPQMSSTSGITSGYSQTFHMVANQTPGDYMYRSGVLKYAVEQGLWGIMRVR